MTKADPRYAPAGMTVRKIQGLPQETKKEAKEKHKKIMERIVFWFHNGSYLPAEEYNKLSDELYSEKRRLESIISTEWK